MCIVLPYYEQCCYQSACELEQIILALVWRPYRLALTREDLNLTRNAQEHSL